MERSRKRATEINTNNKYAAEYENNNNLKKANNQIEQPKFYQTQIRVVSKAKYEQN